MAAQQKQKSLHEDFQEITEQIERLELMQIENCREIVKLYKDNAALKATIEQLKTKRRQIVFLGVHIPER